MTPQARRLDLCTVYVYNAIDFTKGVCYERLLLRSFLMNHCKNCGTEISSKAIYCSDRCRKSYSRRTDKVGQTNPDTEVGQANPDILNYGQKDCQCMHCQQNRRGNLKLIVNHGNYKRLGELLQGEVNRVSLPGDIDYV